MNESEKKKPSGVNYIELCPPRAPLKCHQNLSDGNVSQMKASWASFSCRHPTSRYFWHFSSVYYTRYFKIRLDQHIFRVFLVFFCFFFKNCVSNNSTKKMFHFLLTELSLLLSCCCVLTTKAKRAQSKRIRNRANFRSCLKVSIFVCFASRSLLLRLRGRSARSTT